MFVITYDDWEVLHFHGAVWLQKRTGDGLLILHRRAGNGIDRTMYLNADISEAELFYALSGK